MDENRPSGYMFLKVTGILMIIFGGIATVFGLIAALALVAISANAFDSAMPTTILLIGSIVVIGVCCLELVAGIIGVVNCKKPEKAGVCITWGYILVILSAISIVLSFIGELMYSTSSIGGTLASGIIGLVLPVLYLIGGLKNKKDYKAIVSPEDAE